MNVYRQGIAVLAAAARDDQCGPAFIGGNAKGVVRDATTCVPVPGTCAKAAGRRLNICDASVRGPVGERAYGHSAAFAVCGGGGRGGSDQTEIERHAIDSWRERDIHRLPYDRARVAGTEGYRVLLRAARDRDTKRNCKKQQNY